MKLVASLSRPCNSQKLIIMLRLILIGNPYAIKQHERYKYVLDRPRKFYIQGFDSDLLDSFYRNNKTFTKTMNRRTCRTFVSIETQMRQVRINCKKIRV